MYNPQILWSFAHLRKICSNLSRRHLRHSATNFLNVYLRSRTNITFKRNLCSSTKNAKHSRRNRGDLQRSRSRNRRTNSDDLFCSRRGSNCSDRRRSDMNLETKFEQKKKRSKFFFPPASKTIPKRAIVTTTR